MYAILASAVGFLLSWLVRVVVVKVLVFGLLLLVTTEFTAFILTKLSALNLASVNGLIGGLPAGVLWSCNLVRLEVGLPLVITAALTRFAIRRIPFIG